MNALTAVPSDRMRTLAALVCACTLIAGCGPPANTPPTADAGPDQTVDAGASVTLDGSASGDPDRDVLTFSWAQTQGTPVTLSSTSDPVVTFTAPPNGTTLAFTLTVSDSQNSATAVTHVGVHPVEQSAQVIEMQQRSVTEDASAMGNFPSDWLIPSAGAGLPPTPPDDSEITEFAERFKNSQAPKILQQDLASGDTATVSLQIAGPSALAGLAQWIGTTDALTAAISLDGTALGTGTTYQMGTDRGGSYMHGQAAAGGLAALSVTNTSGVTVTVRLTLVATAH